MVYYWHIKLSDPWMFDRSHTQKNNKAWNCKTVWHWLQHWRDQADHRPRSFGRQQEEQEVWWSVWRYVVWLWVWCIFYIDASFFQRHVECGFICIWSTSFVVWWFGRLGIFGQEASQKMVGPHAPTRADLWAAWHLSAFPWVSWVCSLNDAHQSLAFVRRHLHILLVGFLSCISMFFDGLDDRFWNEQFIILNWLINLNQM